MELLCITRTLHPIWRPILVVNRINRILPLVLVVGPNRAIIKQDILLVGTNPAHRPTFLEGIRRNNRTTELGIKDHRITTLLARHVGVLIREAPLQVLQVPRILSNLIIPPMLGVKTLLGLLLQVPDHNRAMIKQDILLVRITPGRLLFLEATPHSNHTTTKDRILITLRAHQEGLPARIKEDHRLVLLEHRVPSSPIIRQTLLPLSQMTLGVKVFLAPHQ